MKFKKFIEAVEKNNIVCYKTKDGDEYLAYYSDKPDEDVEMLNRDKPDVMPNGGKVNWDKVDYFYADYQDPHFFDD